METLLEQSSKKTTCICKMDPKKLVEHLPDRLQNRKHSKAGSRPAELYTNW
jgi:hypothetical protein